MSHLDSEYATDRPRAPQVQQLVEQVSVNASSIGLWLTFSFPRFLSFSISLLFSQANLLDQVLLLLGHFCRYPDAEVQAWALQAVGQLCVRHPSYLLRTTNIMEAALAPSASPKLKIQILRTFTDLLQQDELRMQALATSERVPTAAPQIDTYAAVKPRLPLPLSRCTVTV